ncbi:hypothetical protein D3C80_391690 [compost metagenome]
MASCSQKPCLAKVCFFGCGLCLCKLLVHMRQLGSTIRDALLKNFGRLLAHQIGLNFGSNVCIGCDKPPIRHGIRIDLQHLSGRFQRHAPWLSEGCKRPYNRMLRVDGKIAAAGQMLDNFGHRNTDLHHFIRQIKMSTELTVPACQPQILVEHRYALIHLIERNLQKIPILLQGDRRIIKQLPCVTRRGIVALEKQRQDETRRRGTDSSAQQLLRIADQRCVHRHAGIEPALLSPFKTKESPLNTFGSEIAGHGCFEFCDRNRCPKALEGRRTNKIARQKNTCLNTFKRCGGT